MENRIISTQIENVTENYRCKLGCVDRVNTTSAYINIQARVTIINGIDIDANFRRFRSILNQWLYKESREIFEGLTFNLIKSVEYSDSSRSHSSRNKTVLNFELTFLFDKQIDFKNELHRFDAMTKNLIKFFNEYTEMSIEGSAK